MKTEAKRFISLDQLLNIPVNQDDSEPEIHEKTTQIVKFLDSLSHWGEFYMWADKFQQAPNMAVTLPVSEQAGLEIFLRQAEANAKKKVSAMMCLGKRVPTTEAHADQVPVYPISQSEMLGLTARLTEFPFFSKFEPGQLMVFSQPIRDVPLNLTHFSLQDLRRVIDQPAFVDPDSQEELSEFRFFGVVVFTSAGALLQIYQIDVFLLWKALSQRGVNLLGQLKHYNYNVLLTPVHEAVYTVGSPIEVKISPHWWKWKKYTFGNISPLTQHTP